MPDLGEQITTAFMAGKIEMDTADRLMDIHLGVVRAIQCPITRRALDSRSAHLITAINSDGQTGTSVVHPSTSAEDITARLREHGLTLKERFDPVESWRQVEHDEVRS